MDAKTHAHEQRERIIDGLHGLPLHEFTDDQLGRLSKALENALDDIESECVRRDWRPQDWM